MALRAPAVGARDAFAELADLWVVGVNTPHDLGCACGGFAAPSIAAGDIERDFLSYLAGKYRAASDLGALIETRIKAPQGPFDGWIAGLGKAGLSPESSMALSDDLRVFLESFGGRSRFAVCY